MASNTKKVTLDVAVKTQEQQIDALEKKLEDTKKKANELNLQKINMKIDADTAKLEQTKSEINSVQIALDNLKNKKVPVGVTTNELESAKNKANELANKKIQMHIAADSKELDETRAKIKSLQGQMQEIFRAKSINADFTVDDSKLKSLQSEIDALNGKAVDLEANIEKGKIDALQEELEELNGKAITIEANVEKGKVDALKEEIESMNGKTVTVPVTTTGGADLSGLQNQIMGVAGSIGMVDQATKMWNASTARQSQQFYLAANLGASEAQKMQREIQNIVAQVPGDDTFMNQLMTTALAQNTKMTTNELQKMASVAADYMAGSKMMGKMNLESQQDIYKYLLDGNTAELERGSILSSQVDKLKDQATIQDRIKAINEALQTMGYAGISGYDTAANNLEEFQGRLEKARADWGDVFLPFEQGALKAAMALDDQYGGALSMAIAGTQALVPTVITAVSGFGEFYRGLEALKETRIGEWASTAKDKLSGIGSSIRNIDFSGKFNGIVNGLKNIGSAAGSAASKLGSSLVNSLRTVGNVAKTAAVSIGKFTINLIKSGVEAVIAAGKWLIAKGVLIAQRTATMLAAGAQAFLNLVMSMNPIMLVVIAITALIAVLGYLYFTNEDVRNAINSLGQALWGLGGTIYGYLVGAFEYLQGAWQNTVDWFSNGAQTISDTVTGAFTWLAESATGSLEWLSGAWQNTVNWFTSGAQWINDSVTGAFTWLLDIWNQVVNAFNTYAPLVAQVLFVMATGGVGAIVLLIMNFMGMPTQVGTALQNVINRVLGFVSSLVSNFTNGARQSVSNFMNQIKSLPGKFLAELNRMLSYVNDWAATLPAKFWEAGVNAVKNFLNALGIHSPGFMAVNFSEEIKRLEDSATYNAIADRISGTAKDIVHAWGSPELEYQVNQLLDKESQNTKNDNNSLIELLRIIIDILRNLPKPEGGSFTFNHYGDTDSEARMERIIEAVRRDFYWNNEKAGRNVEELYGV